MFEYELQKIHTAELIRRAENQRLVREVREAGRESRRQARRAAKDAGEERDKRPGSRFVRAA
ncbi:MULTISPECIES: hypothetical protein [unclassified Streptomyces]|uniref:hypothetical protein n=1 Tax=unclassified Streptomyces TaxID=2593676 RepID=UPI00081F3BD6|nr:MULTISPECIES: hypothetical protein [unclassified Streptomyces]MYZ34106.1 hypothetical protein [Streptomyces sp. SID4917]SCF64183.1 hypothetical protein GA0115259_100526 [Streptomyces sp. MnatMP-M17]